MKLQTPDGRTYITDSEVEVAQLVGTKGYKLISKPTAPTAEAEKAVKRTAKAEEDKA